MSSKLNLWRIYNQAREWSKTPAEMLFLTDTYVAYCFNEAVFTFGRFVQGELDKIKRKTRESDSAYTGRLQRRLDTLLAEEGYEPPMRFANPMPMVRTSNG